MRNNEKCLRNNGRNSWFADAWQTIWSISNKNREKFSSSNWSRRKETVLRWWRFLFLWKEYCCKFKRIDGECNVSNDTRAHNGIHTNKIKQRKWKYATQSCSFVFFSHQGEKKKKPIAAWVSIPIIRLLNMYLVQPNHSIRPH